MTLTAPLPPWFPWLAGFLHDKAGIVLPENKAYLAHTRLGPLLRASPDPDLDALLGRLRTTHDVELEQQVLDAFTTNETSFFRDPHVFECLAKHALPELIERNRPHKELKIWSAAASSGQEAYSLCMLLLDRFPEVRSWKLHILGTDLNHAVLEKARKGVYRSHEARRGLSEDYRQQFMRQVPKGFQVKEALRERVDFRVHNLVHPRPPERNFDLILLRNVLIYFDTPTQLAVLDTMHRAMARRGVLVLGGTEAATQFPSNLFVQERTERTSWLRRIP